MTPRRALGLFVIVAVIAGVIAVARKGETYAQQVAAACTKSYDNLGKPAPPGVPEAGYFTAVVVVAETRMATMSALRPPAEHATMHREILTADAELARRGRISADRLALVGTSVLAQNDLPQLRSLEAAQKRRFQAIGVEDCSN